MTSSSAKPLRALISVANKSGLIDFAKRLQQSGVDILSTGGTAKTLREAGIEVTDVSEHTGFPEIMAGRVKTLHPNIHGGILARRGTDEAVMAEHGIAAIDLVVVNLYHSVKPSPSLTLRLERRLRILILVGQPWCELRQRITSMLASSSILLIIRASSAQSSKIILTSSCVVLWR